MISVKYFASLRERFGRKQDQFDINTPTTVGEIWHRVTGGEFVPHTVVMAVNKEYVDLDQIVEDGDEVAFFPPVTGG